MMLTWFTTTAAKLCFDAALLSIWANDNSRRVRIAALSMSWRKWNATESTTTSRTGCLGTTRTALVAAFVCNGALLVAPPIST